MKFALNFTNCQHGLSDKIFLAESRVKRSVIGHGEDRNKSKNQSKYDRK